MIREYSLDELDTADAVSVEAAVLELQGGNFRGVNASDVINLFADVSAMFDGDFWDYQKMDTVYHDIEHTLQATLCWVRLIACRQSAEDEPVMTDDDFLKGIHAVLLHDMGFLKAKSDPIGTGAKYTFVHEKRSCELAELYLTRKGWRRAEIFVVQHLISCTGPRSMPETIPFSSALERFLGQSICTADYLAQMSDPDYVEKLPTLFSEFEESDDYREIPVENRTFRSSEELVRLTPLFWERIVIPKLKTECNGAYRYLASPYPDGENPYFQGVEKTYESFAKRTGSKRNGRAISERKISISRRSR